MNFEALMRFNGQDADAVLAVGPFVAGNRSRYWLIRIEANGQLITADDWLGEFACVSEPHSEALGWDLTHVPFKTHYAFADACLNLLAQRDAAVEALKAALDDLEQWHAAHYQTDEDGTRSDIPCKYGGCETCDVIIPKMKAAIAAAEGEAV